MSTTDATGAPMRIQIRVCFARGNTGPVFGTCTLDLAQLAPAAKTAAITGSR